jgi:hypothetical protein
MHAASLTRADDADPPVLADRLESRWETGISGMQRKSRYGTTETRVRKKEERKKRKGKERKGMTGMVGSWRGITLHCGEISESAPRKGSSPGAIGSPRIRPEPLC